MSLEFIIDNDRVINFKTVKYITIDYDKAKKGFKVKFHFGFSSNQFIEKVFVGLDQISKTEPEMDSFYISKIKERLLGYLVGLDSKVLTTDEIYFGFKECINEYIWHYLRDMKIQNRIKRKK